MNKRIIKLSLLGLGGVNLFLVLSGIVIPWLVSTNLIPVAAIFFILSSIICAIVTVICCYVYRHTKE